MKYIGIIFTILSGFLFSQSCIREDLSVCSKNNVVLKLHYLGDTQNTDLFGKKIKCVTVFVFNKENKFVHKQIFNKKDIIDQCVVFRLPSGQSYKIICWGQASANTLFTAGLSLNEFRVNHPNYGKTGTSISTNDPLYMAKASVDVKPSSLSTAELYFEGAHNTLEIYVENFGKKEDPSTYPIIEVSNLMPQCDLEMKPVQSSAYSYYPIVKFDKEHDILAAMLHTFLFDNDNQVFIIIRNPVAHDILSKFSLKEYMIANSISINGKNERKISVLIRFSDLGVVVTIPRWDIIDLKP